MKHLAVALLFICISYSAISQTKEEKAVASAVENMRKAMVDANQKALTQLADSKLSYGHSSGKLEDKAAFVENIVNGNSDFTDITLTDQTITIQGTTAVVRHKLFAHTNDKGKEPGTVNLYILLVWTKVQGEWKLLARQAVKVPA
jgi:ketosteroid isomerase-like protein